MSTENNRSTPESHILVQCRTAESWKPRENEVKLPNATLRFMRIQSLRIFYQETSPTFDKLDCKKFLLIIFSLSSLSLEGLLRLQRQQTSREGSFVPTV